MKSKTLVFISLIVMLSLILSACGGAASQPKTAAGDLQGTIGVSGAFALYPMMTVWADEFTKLHPAVQFDVQGGGAGKGMTDALAGAVDIGMVSRAIKDEEASQGAYWVAVTKDAVFPILSVDNPVLADIQAQGISQETFNKIFITKEIKTWGQVVGKPEITDEINVYTRSDSAGAAEMWAKFSGGKVQDDLSGVAVNGEPAMVDTVIKDPLGIGYSNMNSVFDLGTGQVIPGVALAPIDVNKDGKAGDGEYFKSKTEAVAAVSSGKYPSPPARFENLVTKGKPSGLAKTFIEWILTDGQKYLDQAGYVPLTPEQQAESLAKLK
jgi:phosphate transport system substrate-binding protein